MMVIQPCMHAKWDNFNNLLLADWFHSESLICSRRSVLHCCWMLPKLCPLLLCKYQILSLYLLLIKRWYYKCFEYRCRGEIPAPLRLFTATNSDGRPAYATAVYEGMRLSEYFCVVISIFGASVYFIANDMLFIKLQKNLCTCASCFRR